MRPGSKLLSRSAAISLSWLIATLACSTPAPLPHYSVLHGTEARRALAQCSRPIPGNVSDVWVPDGAIIQQLENDLPKLAALAVRQGFQSESAIDGPSARRQYAGVSIHGHRYIYINGGQAETDPRLGRESDIWLRKAIVACDGGEAFWGALYDPLTREFSQLQGNGLG